MGKSPIHLTGEIPEKSMRRIGEGIADLLSPITETAGLLGDAVGLPRDWLRHHRELMVEKRLRAALDRAHERNLQIGRAPVKFIVGWTEGVSLEDDRSELNELWENLLIKAVTSYEDYLGMFIDILRRFGGSEVSVLRTLAEKDEDLNFSNHPRYEKRVKVAQFPADVFDSLPSDIEDAWRVIEGKFGELARVDMLLVGAAFESDQIRVTRPIEYYERNSLAFDVLSAGRLIGLEYVVSGSPENGEDNEYNVVRILAAFLTDLGREFVRACMAWEPLQENRDNN